MTTALFILRVAQLGLGFDALEYLTFGDVMDILTENGNDGVEHAQRATQEDFDRF